MSCPPTFIFIFQFVDSLFENNAQTSEKKYPILKVRSATRGTRRAASGSGENGAARNIVQSASQYNIKIST